MKDKHIKAHMQAAYVYAALSSCKRRQVGCIIVKDDNIIAIGYNGTNPGESNDCEDEDGNTLPNTRHAEDNALRKLTKSTSSGEGAVAFITTAPCAGCASRLEDAGIVCVYYDDVYRNENGLEYLLRKGIDVVKVNLEK